MARARSPGSLRGRLLLWLLVPLCLIGVLALVDTYASARETANAVFDRVLAGSALAIAERVVVGPDGELEVDVPYIALDMLTSAAHDRVFYKIEGPPGRFLTGYRNLPAPDPAPGDAIPGRPSFSDADFRGEPIRLASLRGAASTGERSLSFRVTVAETTNARRNVAQAILIRTAARQALLIGIAALIVWFGVKWALRPLARLEEAIGRRSQDDLRPIEHPVPGEVTRVVESVNGLMQRLQGALVALRNFTGNASHQLRTPLSVVRTQIELSRRAQTEAAKAAALTNADRAVGQTERTLSQLLVLAQIDEASADRVGHELFDLTDVARKTTTDYLAKSGKAGIDLGFEAPEQPISLRGDSMLIAELLKNLVENALAYAGRGRSATVRVTQEVGGPALEVEDDGPGIPSDQHETALARFSRLSKDDDAGSGLGLAIVSEIVALFGASLTLGDGQGGRGLRVRVQFPPSSAGAS